MLTKNALRKAWLKGDVVIEPFNEKNLNPNSYNLSLGGRLKRYVGLELDMAVEPQTEDVEPIFIPQKDGTVKQAFRLFPNVLYLGGTMERFGSKKKIAKIKNRSGTARYGLFVELSAGFGDLGFENYWTLELFLVGPHTLIVYPFMPICQGTFEEPEGIIEEGGLYVGKYKDQGPEPTASRMFLEHK